MIEIIDLSHGSTVYQMGQNKIIEMLRNNNVEIPEDYRYWDVEDKEKFFLPYLKKNPELYKEYKEALEAYEKSMYGIISNPETGKFEYTKGKMSVRRNDAFKFLLDDGRVILIGGQSATENGSSVESAHQIEIFDSKSGEFKLIKYDEKRFKYSIHDVFKIGNQNIFMMGNNGYFIYNLNDNSLSEKISFLEGWKWRIKSQLDNDRLLVYAIPDNNADTSKIKNKDFLLQGQKKQYILVYNIKTDTFECIGHLLIFRNDTSVCPFSSSLLKDNKILTFGGVKSTDIFGYNYPTKTAEVFDIETGKSKQTKNMNYERKHSSSILLDDGRVLIYGYPATYKDNGSIYRYMGEIELYIPKGYDK